MPPKKTKTAITKTLTAGMKKFTKKLKNKEDIFAYKCPGCGGIHFRHAGYIETILPYVKANLEEDVTTQSYSVKVCIGCEKCYIYIDKNMLDITEHIDLKKWAKLERKVFPATGEGGSC